MTEYCFASIDKQSNYTGMVLYVRSQTELEARTKLNFQYPTSQFKLMNEYLLDCE